MRAAALILPLALLPACGPTYSLPREAPRSIVEAYAFMAPASVRIHPLTRLETDDQGRWRLACHLELLDRADHGIKWLGSVRIELLRPESASSATRELIYDHDLSSPEANARAYDWITRTYVILLAEPPQWALDADRGDAALSLRVIFSFLAPDGSTTSLESTFTLRR